MQWYCTASPVARFAFDNDHVDRLPTVIHMAEGVQLVLPSGEARFLERIELEIAFERHRSDTAFERRVYGQAGVAFAAKTYTRGNEKAHFTFSMLQQGNETTAGVSVRNSDGNSAFVITPKMKAPPAAED